MYGRIQAFGPLSSAFALRKILGEASSVSKLLEAPGARFEVLAVGSRRYPGLWLTGGIGAACCEPFNLKKRVQQALCDLARYIFRDRDSHKGSPF